MMRTYYAMLIERGELDSVGKMKQFATYFTHGVRNGAQLRAAIYHATEAPRILELVDEFFEPRSGGRLSPVKKVKLITDGSCLGNPGRGGWACILRYNEHKRELYGCAPHTTNNRMELTAAIEGLKALKEPCEVQVVTDSEYLKNGITTWVPNWKRRNWMTATRKPVVNRDLWEELDGVAARHTITWPRRSKNHTRGERECQIGDKQRGYRTDAALQIAADTAGGFGGGTDRAIRRTNRRRAGRLRAMGFLATRLGGGGAVRGRGIRLGRHGRPHFGSHGRTRAKCRQILGEIAGRAIAARRIGIDALEQNAAQRLRAGVRRGRRGNPRTNHALQALRVLGLVGLRSR